MGSEELIGAFGRAMQEYQRAVDALDQRAADRLGINRTDMRCLELLFSDDAEKSPGELAAAAGMTTGGVTTAIDRLERAGYVTRERDATDRRRVTVRPTPRAERAVFEIYGPVVEQGRTILARFDDTVLAGMIEVLEQATRQHNEHAEALGHVT
ncbi:MarR family winged helix-turn-helix transcriptional regulator [Dactylosporangium sp. CS-047395]|uniref:MarR family winged helix-turn-helix transcriptional regulator n=1 Tax=Dactylosporangium sp. CS-047395 TaxID=3239936 RepID=UPI003D9146E7